ncbi:tubulin epsilon and delta complex protein 2 [Channa argus]|uniref:tubulin epsilon and delta complex protein 2 n=1 Tax=Channa argus TaxID=215402 RepID=UPI0029445A60|nr:hypothetical protein Q8A73_016313 [Channa argus]
MSLLSIVERTIKLYKAEQAKINDSIQLYRDILQSLSAQSKTGSERPECADNTARDTDTSPLEKEEIELLEQALEKALRVRTGLRVSVKDPNKDKQHGFRKEPGATSGSSKDVTLSSALPKGRQTTIRSSSKSTHLDQKWHKSGSSTLGSGKSANYNLGKSKTTDYRIIIQNYPVSSAGFVQHQAAKKLADLASGTFDHILTLDSQRTTIRDTVLNGSDLGKVTSVSIPSTNKTVPFSHKYKSGTHSVLQHSGTSSEQKVKWKSLRTKQNRLWEKIIALQRNPVPGRSYFMERMRAMFPEDWPCGSPDHVRLLVNRLIHQGHDLTQHCQTKELLAKHNPDVATELGGRLSDYDSHLTLERLQMTVAEIHSFADKVKQEWEAWDRWRPDGGCLCPSGASGAWGDAMIASLPITINYTTEAELLKLENLRMRVALLQQEIYLEQALLDTLFPQLFLILPGPGCPKPSLLRDMYSLLGEGGECFPAIVLDSEPD